MTRNKRIVECLECRMKFQQIAHPASLYYCPKCELYNCEEIESEKFTTLQELESKYSNAKRPVLATPEIIVEFFKNKFED